MDIPSENKRTVRPETFFLPPLKMILAFFDRELHADGSKNKDAEKQEDAVEKTVTRLIEKLSEKDE